MLNQIKNNLDNNLLETEHFQLRKDRFRLITDIIHPIVNIFRGQIKMQKLKIEVIYEHEDDPYVIVDQLRVQQIMINLVQNSIKFSKENDKITVTINRRMTPDQNFSF